MLQKVAANVDNVAADLCFRASEVRWLLMKIFFCYCRYFCRYLLCTSINIVIPYLRHFSSFVPKIYDFERRIDVNNMRKLLYYKNFRIGVFFWKEVDCAEDCAESELIRNSCEFDFQPIHYLFCFACRSLFIVQFVDGFFNVLTHVFLGIYSESIYSFLFIKFKPIFYIYVVFIIFI